MSKYLDGVDVLGAMARGNFSLTPPRPVVRAPVAAIHPFVATRAAAGQLAAAPVAARLSPSRPLPGAVAFNPAVAKTGAALPIAAAAGAAKAATAAQQAVDARATANLSAAAGKAQASAQRLMASARKSKRLGAKATAIANALLRKANGAAAKAAHRVMGMVVGTSVAITSFDGNELNALATQMIAQGSEADALSIATDINAEMGDYVDQFTKLNLADLVSSATALGNRAYDIVNAYPTDGTGDPTVQRRVAALQTDVDAWHPAAWSALRAAALNGTLPSGGATTPAGSVVAGSAAFTAAMSALTTAGTGAYSLGQQLMASNQMIAQQALAAGQQALSTATTGQALAQGADATAWMAQAKKDTDAANTAAATASQFLSASGGGAGDSGGGGGGGFGGGGDSGGGAGDFGDDSAAAATAQDMVDEVAPFDGQDGGDAGLDWGDAVNSFDASAMFDEAPIDTSSMTDDMNTEAVVGANPYLIGVDVLGAETIPTAGAVYTDSKTVLAVQAALKAHGFSPGTLDGIMGPNTAKAIRAMQSAAGIPATGVIDEGVIMALGVTPGVLPPGVTAAGKASVEAQVALDAATAVEHAVTPSDLAAAAAKVVDAAPAQPPELKQAAAAAHAAVTHASTPAELGAARAQVQAVAAQVQAAVSPGWWGQPLWAGAPVKRWQGVVGGGAGIAVGVALLMIARRR